MTTTKKSTKKSTAKKATTSTNATLTDSQFYGKLRRLSPGHAVTSDKFGTVKCTRSAKDSKNGKKMFSISKSKVAQNRGNYTLGEIVEVFGLSK